MDGLQPCVKLHTLYLGNNKIKSWDEIGKVAQLPEIRTVLFFGNPAYGDKSRDENAPYVVKRVPQVETVDGKLVSPALRKQAEELD